MRTLSDAAPGVLDAIEAKVERVYKEAYAKWPIGRSFDPSRNGQAHSKWQLERGTVIDGDRVRGYVRNSAPWSRFIRPRKLYGATTAAREWIQLPMRKASRELVKELGAVLIDAMRGG